MSILDDPEIKREINNLERYRSDNISTDMQNDLFSCRLSNMEIIDKPKSILKKTKRKKIINNVETAYGQFYSERNMMIKDVNTSITCNCVISLIHDIDLINSQIVIKLPGIYDIFAFVDCDNSRFYITVNNKKINVSTKYSLRTLSKLNEGDIIGINVKKKVRLYGWSLSLKLIQSTN